MKRKNEEPHGLINKRTSLSEDEVRRCFGKGVFSQREYYAKEYAQSQPYKHGVIQGLIDPSLLRSVRSEIQEHLHFTPKETDIYKIHQSGDLANLDGLDDSSLSRLPCLLRLRDALYSSAFREYISHVANAGPVSGKKTDMAINIYTPTCHLLCHDDVIGSRRISYILYLTDPDRPWKPEWGGALQLYPTQKLEMENGTVAIVPHSDPSVSIPPAFNQLSFFTIQPGESFHDVEEVRTGKDSQDQDDGKRVRMAISGWFHIPQEGEDGFEEGEEERLAERSSLQQLQNKTDDLDLPQPHWRDVQSLGDKPDDEADFSEAELDWLLRFINPNYLVPDAIEAISESFEENCVASLVDFLHPKFAEMLREYIESLERGKSLVIPPLTDASNNVGIARPPHKHRFVFRQAMVGVPENASDSPLDQLLEHLFPSPIFARWLSLVTGLSFTRAEFLARRFRRGLDYTLATSYNDTDPQLELCLGITPSPGWGNIDPGDDDEDEDITARAISSGGDDRSFANRNLTGNGAKIEKDGEPVGGYEMYMAGDDDDADGNDLENDIDVIHQSSHTGAGRRRNAKADPAIYRTSGEEDDGVLFSHPASWNTLNIVLRDTGVMKFVKYVSESARGDRWDLVANYSVAPDEEDE